MMILWENFWRKIVLASKTLQKKYFRVQLEFHFFCFVLFLSRTFSNFSNVRKVIFPLKTHQNCFMFFWTSSANFWKLVAMGENSKLRFPSSLQNLPYFVLKCCLKLSWIIHAFISNFFCFLQWCLITWILFYVSFSQLVYFGIISLVL